MNAHDNLVWKVKNPAHLYTFLHSLNAITNDESRNLM